MEIAAQVAAAARRMGGGDPRHDPRRLGGGGRRAGRVVARIVQDFGRRVPQHRQIAGPRGEGVEAGPAARRQVVLAEPPRQRQQAAQIEHLALGGAGGGQRAEQPLPVRPQRVEPGAGMVVAGPVAGDMAQRGAQHLGDRPELLLEAAPGGEIGIAGGEVVGPQPALQGMFLEPQPAPGGGAGGAGGGLGQRHRQQPGVVGGAAGGAVDPVHLLARRLVGDPPAVAQDLEAVALQRIVGAERPRQPRRQILPGGAIVARHRLAERHQMGQIGAVGMRPAGGLGGGAEPGAALGAGGEIGDPAPRLERRRPLHLFEPGHQLQRRLQFARRHQRHQPAAEQPAVRGLGGGGPAQRPAEPGLGAQEQRMAGGDPRRQPQRRLDRRPPVRRPGPEAQPLERGPPDVHPPRGLPLRFPAPAPRRLLAVVPITAPEAPPCPPGASAAARPGAPSYFSRRGVYMAPGAGAGAPTAGGGFPPGRRQGAPSPPLGPGRPAPGRARPFRHARGVPAARFRHTRGVPAARRGRLLTVPRKLPEYGAAS